MHFDVMSGIPSLAGNALKSGDRTAAERQTPFEHDSILDEKNLPEYPAVLYSRREESSRVPSSADDACWSSA